MADGFIPDLTPPGSAQMPLGTPARSTVSVPQSTRTINAPPSPATPMSTPRVPVARHYRSFPVRRAAKKPSMGAKRPR